jgi:hypothetical protein
VDNRGIEVLFPGEERDFCVLYNFHAFSVSHQASYSAGIRGSFPGDKSARA